MSKQVNGFVQCIVTLSLVANASVGFCQSDKSYDLSMKFKVAETSKYKSNMTMKYEIKGKDGTPLPIPN